MATVADERTVKAVGDVPTQLHIHGEWRDAANGATFDDIAPATEETLATISAAGAEDIDRAVRAARAQLEGGAWSRLTGADRGRLITRLAELIERDFDKLALLDAVDGGKPVMGA